MWYLLGVTQLVGTVIAAVPRQPVLSASAQFSLPRSPVPTEDTGLHPDRGCKGSLLSEGRWFGFVGGCSLWSSSPTHRQGRFEMLAIPKPVFYPMPSDKAFQVVPASQLYRISSHQWLLPAPPACFPNSSCWSINPWKTRALVRREVGEGVRPRGSPWST